MTLTATLRIGATDERQQSSVIGYLGHTDQLIDVSRGSGHNISPTVNPDGQRLPVTTEGCGTEVFLVSYVGNGRILEYLFRAVCVLTQTIRRIPTNSNVISY